MTHIFELVFVVVFVIGIFLITTIIWMVKNKTTKPNQIVSTTLSSHMGPSNDKDSDMTTILSLSAIACAYA